MTMDAVTLAAARARIRGALVAGVALASTGRLYCSTNGCTSFLVIDTDRRIAACEVCGYTRRLH